MSVSTPALLALCVVLTAGSAARLIGLERAPLHNNELNHYYVARSLQQGSDPVLPSGEWYTRGLDYSRVVALTLDRVEPIERAVRLPAAMLGCLALLLFSVIAWQLAGPWAAVYATLLLAVYPEAIDLSRFGRFYTMQLVYGLVALYAGYRALNVGTRQGAAYWRPWAWMLVAVAAFLLAARIQVVTLSVALGWGVAVVAVAIADTRALGKHAPSRSVPLQALVIAALTVGFWALLRPDGVQQLFVRATATPNWVSAESQSNATYIGYLVANLPVVAMTGVAAFYWVVRRDRALGLYLLAWFGVPFLLHSFLPWKGGRFILLAMPALLLAVGILAAALLRALYAFLHEHLSRTLVCRPLPRVAATAAVSTIALATIPPTPALKSVLRPARDVEVMQGWRASRQIIASLPGVEAIPLGHSLPLPALHYVGRLDFNLNETLRERWLTRERKRALLGVDELGGYVWLPVGAPDLYAGKPVLSTAEAIRARYATVGSVLIGAHATGGLPSELHETLRAEARELCQGRCGPMLLYHWTFGGMAESPKDGRMGAWGS